MVIIVLVSVCFHNATFISFCFYANIAIKYIPMQIYLFCRRLTAPKVFQKREFRRNFAGRIKVKPGLPLKGSIVIVSFFVAGVLTGMAGIWTSSGPWDDYTRYALYLLMFLVGASLGAGGKIREMFRSLGIKTLLVPIATITGTLAFSALAALMISRYSVYDCMAIGSGFGYYSLSSVFITQYKGAELGTVALMTNIFREIITLLFAPLLVRFFSPLAPICAGGATTMDTTLGVITRFSGREYVFIAVFHGAVVDFTVPFFVTFFCGL